MQAFLKNYRQSPRKVRLVGNLIKGAPVSRARLLLDHTPKRATLQMKKLLESAIANALHNEDKQEHDLIVADVRVQKGFTMKRYRPRAHGRASRIRKFTSHVTIVLKDAIQKDEETKEKASTIGNKATSKTTAKTAQTTSKKTVKVTGAKKKTIAKKKTATKQNSKS